MPKIEFFTEKKTPSSRLLSQQRYGFLCWRLPEERRTDRMDRALQYEESADDAVALNAVPFNGCSE